VAEPIPRQRHRQVQRHNHRRQINKPLAARTQQRSISTAGQVALYSYMLEEIASPKRTIGSIFANTVTAQRASNWLARHSEIPFLLNVKAMLTPELRT
jgi:hypothetical protein